MDLALGGAGADGSPAYEAGDVLGRDHVEELGSGGDAHLGKVEQEVTGFAEAVVDPEGLVQVRVVDEALPAEGCARLLEVDAHDDAELLREFGDGGFEAGAVFACGLGVVDGAWADDYDETMVFGLENVADLAARLEDGRGRLFCDWQLFFKKDWRKDNFGPFDAKVVGWIEHRSYSAESKPQGLAQGDAKKILSLLSYQPSA